MHPTVGIGLLGCGTVGTAVAERLIERAAPLRRAAGIAFELRAIAVRDPRKGRSPLLPPELFTSDLERVVGDPNVDLIVECIGGTGIAVAAIENALDLGRAVVTANKDAIGTQGPRLRALAALRNVPLRFEAAVCAGIPILEPLQALHAGDKVESVAGIVNGTTNAVLSLMEDGASFAEALAFAQQSGFAEAEPSSDIDGHDAAHKLAIIIQRAFGLAVITPRINVTGIAGVTQRDVARATMLGFRIRLIAAARCDDDDVRAQVAPVLLRHDHPFARVRGAQNLLQVHARDAGPLQFGGPGAGGAATASALLTDTVAALRAYNERHETGRTRIALDHVARVAPLFDRLERHPELPGYHVWDDSIMTTADAPASRSYAVHSSPGKERS